MTDPRRTRDAFRRGDEELKPSMERLLAATPGLVREAGRRRAAAAGAPLLTLMVPLAWRAMPRFAACAALLVAIAATLFLADPTPDATATATLTGGVEEFILTGQGDTQADPLLRAIAGGKGT